MIAGPSSPGQRLRPDSATLVTVLERVDLPDPVVVAVGDVQVASVIQGDGGWAVHGDFHFGVMAPADRMLRGRPQESRVREWKRLSSNHPLAPIEESLPDRLHLRVARLDFHDRARAGGNADSSMR